IGYKDGITKTVHNDTADDKEQLLAQLGDLPRVSDGLKHGSDHLRLSSRGFNFLLCRGSDAGSLDSQLFAQLTGAQHTEAVQRFFDQSLFSQKLKSDLGAVIKAVQDVQVDFGVFFGKHVVKAALGKTAGQGHL